MHRLWNTFRYYKNIPEKFDFLCSKITYLNEELKKKSNGVKNLFSEIAVNMTGNIWEFFCEYFYMTFTPIINIFKLKFKQFGDPQDN